MSATRTNGADEGDDMRTTAGLCLVIAALAAGSPALAQDGAPDAATIVGIFRPLPAAELTAGLAGQWVSLPIDNLADETDLDAFRDRACAAGPAAVRTVADAGDGAFTITQGTGERVVTFHLDPLGDSLFSRMFDADAFAAYLGLDRATPVMREGMMRNVAREVTVYRPTPDLLILAAAGRAELMMRCPP